MGQQPVQSYRELVIWQRAVELCVAVYELTRQFPREELYGLSKQLRRAAVSIPSNVAEGYGRLSRDQYKHFLRIAQGSNLELQTQVVIANQLGFATESDIAKIEGLSFEVGRMLTALLRRL